VSKFQVGDLVTITKFVPIPPFPQDHHRKGEKVSDTTCYPSPGEIGRILEIESIDEEYALHDEDEHIICLTDPGRVDYDGDEVGWVYVCAEQIELVFTK
jgi:hypothetical protein